MKRLLLAGFFMMFAGAAHAQLPVVIVDNDGNFGRVSSQGGIEVTVLPSTVPLSVSISSLAVFGLVGSIPVQVIADELQGLTANYTRCLFFSSGGNCSFSGTAKDWLILVEGGSVTVRLNGSGPPISISEPGLGGVYHGGDVSAQFDILFLTPDTSRQVLISGGS